ncbi:MAG: hypothetical protein IT519_11725 [Burkholderiales bacterium]|jgi:hypothetical protein|nr:hypothetical protein [Burkholderiales bacterium]
MTSVVVVADSVTALPESARSAVLVTGSHGGMIAAHYALAAGVRAVVFNDAGRGLDDAGIAGVAALDGAGMAAAAVAHTSARIADGSDTLERGVISFANDLAGALGVAAGMPCREAAERLRAAAAPAGRLPRQRESRLIFAPAGERRTAIVGLDSIGGVVAADAGLVLVIGSHGGLHGGVPASALPVDAAGAIFHDAGGGRDGAGWSRLPVLDARGIPAATAGHLSARIGDARSMWETGELTHVNEGAARTGLREGMTVRASAATLALFRN